MSLDSSFERSVSSLASARPHSCVPPIPHGRIASLVILMLAMAGCGPANPLGREALSGRVTLDGEPLTQGSISFEPVSKGSVNSGAPVVDGRYAIEAHRGLPPGRYRVRINASQSDPAAIAKLPPGAPEPPGIELIPAEYNTRSEEFIEVESGASNQFDFTIGKAE